MSNLDLGLFVNSFGDYESRQYLILSEIGKIRKDFSHNRIYPTLGQLIELYSSLRRITEQADGIRHELPRQIKGIDLQEQRIIYESPHLNNDNLKVVEELIHWALPHIQHAIEEGQTIYNFVDEHLNIGEVGIVPSYLEEGYLLVPDMLSMALHVVRYEVTIYAGVDEKFRNLKTTTLKTLPLSAIRRSPLSIKRMLIEENQELPNPATYIFETDLDFPFQETILPVAKRKFLRQLYGFGRPS